MRARWCALLVAVVLVGWGSPASAEPLTVTPVPLPLPPNSPTVTSLAAANNAGTIVGSAPVRENADAPYEEHALRWRDGVVTDLHPGGVPRSRAVAVNAAGVIGLETSTTLAGTWQASLLIGSRRVPLTPVGATQSRLLALNTLGAALITWSDAAGWHLGLWIAGRLTPIGGAQPTPPAGRLNELGQVATVLDGTAFLWTAGRRTTITTGPVTVADLNDRGQVVGRIGDHGYSWRAGQPTDLGPGEAAAVNNAGQVAGWNGTHAVLWSGGTATDLGTPGRTSRATAINERGQVAGASESTTVLNPGQGGVTHPTVWSGGTATDLTPDELRLGVATALTDTGYVLGTQQAGAFGYPSSVAVPKAWRVR